MKQKYHHQIFIVLYPLLLHQYSSSFLIIAFSNARVIIWNSFLSGQRNQSQFFDLREQIEDDPRQGNVRVLGK